MNKITAQNCKQKSGRVTCLAFSRQNWFIQSYLFLILLSPMINAFVEKVNEMQMTLYMVIFMGCALYFDCLRDSVYFYFNGGYSVTTLVIVYIVGRYMRLYGERKLNLLQRHIPIILYTASVILLIILHYLPDIGLTRYCSPVVIVSSSLLFYLFVRMPKFHSKLINWVSASCLAVYICHTCTDTMFGFLSNTDIRLFNSLPFALYIIIMSAVIVYVFAISILLDKVRLFIFKPLINHIPEKISL